ncbi:unnamed protein product [Scytosiphon promiscuus]
MRIRSATVAGFLLCSCGAPTGDSFFFSSSSCWRASSSASTSSGSRRSSTPHHVTARPTPRQTTPRRRSRRCSRISNSSVAEETSTPASQQQQQQQQQYTAGELGGLSRSELQALCKRLNLRAVGKTSELLSRVLDKQDQDRHPHHGESSDADPTSPSSSSSPAVGADTAAVHDAPAAAAAASLPSSTAATAVLTTVDVGSRGASQGQTAAAAVAVAEEPAADFSLDDVRSVFDELSDEQWAKVEQLGDLLTEWNGKINLISRKDIANVMRRHVVPCLAMAKALNFEDGLYVLDVGTGGGLPGLPLAICYPNVKFTLIDGTGKKIAAVADMAERLGLSNVRTFHIRAEEVHEVFDFVMGRAVTNLPKFVGFIDKNLKSNDPRTNGDPTTAISNTDNDDGSAGRRSSGNSLKRGVLYMRGEVSEEELAELGAQPSAVIPLQRVLEEAGQDGDVGLGGGVNDRGYSSVFHFTSEAIWNRVPVASGSAENE